MLKELANLYTLCFRKGKYPAIWKTAKLVLIPKGGETQDGLPKARPICLLDEVGKSFERIIANRMHEWMAKRQEERFWTLSKNQFSFKQNSSTLDAILKVIRFIEEENNSGNCVIAVSLDIRNAFNSIPWRHIRKALYEKDFRGIDVEYYIIIYQIGKLNILIKKEKSRCVVSRRVFLKIRSLDRYYRI